MCCPPYMSAGVSSTTSVESILITCVVSFITHLNIDSLITHLNVDSLITLLNVDSLITLLNVDSLITHLNVDSLITHLNVDSLITLTLMLTSHLLFLMVPTCYLKQDDV